jgi:hypothetical protein
MMKIRTIAAIASVITIALVMYGITAKTKTPPQVSDRKKAQEMSSELRQRALSTTARALKLEHLRDNEVYGVVMDWGLGEDGVNTVVSFLTGDASMYFSTGGGMIGGGEHEAVRKAAIKYVRYAQQFLPKTVPAQPMPLASGKYVQFYLLTPKGTYTAKTDMTNIENETWELTSLFYEANNMITEYRKVMGKVHQHK